MARESSTPTGISPNQIQTITKYFDLVLISFVILFFELTCIRWFASTVFFLTFFTNLVLMACFLGMSVGCLAASRDQDLIDKVIPLSLWTILLSCGVLVVQSRFGRILVDVGGQGSPQQVFFGTEFRPRDPADFVIPVEIVAGLFFVLITLMFVGLGQVLGRAFNRLPNRVVAYSSNVLGSLAGIAGFAIVSYSCTSPIIWFAISIGACLYFVKTSRMLHATGFLAGLVLIAVFSGSFGDRGDTQLFWSPYYKIHYHSREKEIETNNIWHQKMVRIAAAGPAYMLPYLLNKDAGGGSLEDVLVIGAGTGNDVQAALVQGAKHVDAVEIDPVLYQIGLRDHPDRPYHDSRVSIQIDDGRSFVRKTTKAYDLVSYALVDSLVLHSGYSSLRLESFLFTEQAFRDIKSRLKPNGVFAMYNFYRQGWVVGRLARMAEKVFGTKPLVVSLPYQSRIMPGDSQANHFTLLLVGSTGSDRVEAIRRQFEANQFYWLNRNPTEGEAINAYGAESPYVSGEQVTDWLKIGSAEVDTSAIKLLPTDDWPFLYLREPAIPSLNLRWLLMVAILSLVILFWFAPARSLRPNGQMFFLGAGFMLLETKGVVHMALLFGATWMVNSIIIFAILVMILLSNLFVLWFRPKRRWWLFYGLLIASLILDVYVPMGSYLALPGVARVVVSCSLVFVPLFFAGIIFAVAFRDSQQPDVDLGSNIGGVILGGLSEYLSLIMGFNSLLVIAALYYLISALMVRNINRRRHGC